MTASVNPSLKNILGIYLAQHCTRVLHCTALEYLECYQTSKMERLAETNNDLLLHLRCLIGFWIRYQIFFFMIRFLKGLMGIGSLQRILFLNFVGRYAQHQIKHLNYSYWLLMRQIKLLPRGLKQIKRILNHVKFSNHFAILLGSVIHDPSFIQSCYY